MADRYDPRDFDPSTPPEPITSPDHPSSLFRIRVLRATIILNVNEEHGVRVKDDLALCLISSLGAKRTICMVIPAFVVDDNLWHDCDLGSVIFSCLLSERKMKEKPT